MYIDINISTYMYDVYDVGKERERENVLPFLFLSFCGAPVCVC